jgi:hypothetical protein
MREAHILSRWMEEEGVFRGTRFETGLTPAKLYRYN